MPLKIYFSFYVPCLLYLELCPYLSFLFIYTRFYQRYVYFISLMQETKTKPLFLVLMVFIVLFYFMNVYSYFCNLSFSNFSSSFIYFLIHIVTLEFSVFFLVCNRYTYLLNRVAFYKF